MIETFIILMGVLSVGLIDAAWRQKNIDSNNRFLKAHEHFHAGIEFGILAVIATLLNIQILDSFLWGLGIAFIFSEFTHFGWFKGEKFMVSHPFAFGSEHFKLTHIITIGLCVVGLLLYFLIPTIL